MKLNILRSSSRRKVTINSTYIEGFPFISCFLEGENEEVLFLTDSLNVFSSSMTFRALFI